MSRLLPFSFMLMVIAGFGLAWIVTAFDPQVSPWYIFAAFLLVLFLLILNVLGLSLFFLRTRLYRRYSPNWYFKTSYKMAFFVAFFVVIAAILAILKLVTTFNVAMAILAVGLLAVWSYIGNRVKG